MNNEPESMDASHPTSGMSRRRALQLGAAVAGAAIVAPAVGALPAAAGSGSGGARTAPCAFGRDEASFDEGWKFLRSDASGAEATSFDDSAWRTLDLPHDWSIEDLAYATSDDGGATADPSTMAFQTTPPPAGTPTVIGPFDQTASVGGRGTGYTVSGIGWYRKHFNAPSGSLNTGARTLVRFDGVFHNSTVWINGHQVATHQYGYTPFVVDLTPYLGRGSNVLAVKVDNTAPDARWYSGSGIYRHTFISVVPTVAVPEYGVFVTTPTVAQRRSTVHVVAEAVNSGASVAKVRARISVLDSRGHTVASTLTAAKQLAAGASGEFIVDVTVERASLWSPRSPVLYTAKTELLVDNRTSDTIKTPFGIRDVVWDGQAGLFINGKNTKIRGACLHSGYGPLGAQALNRSVERQVEILKASGFNSIRTAHNPPTPHLLDVCDRMGMLVWDEAFDHWSGGSFSPDPAADLATFIRRDRNHPSVIIWSTGNEVSDPTLGKVLHDQVNALDPTRPATQGATPFDSAADPQYDYTDVTDVHYGFTDRLALRTKFPNRVMTHSEAWPATIYDDWKYAQDHPWFVGSWVWAGWDYMGESGAGATITAPPGATSLPVFGTGPFPWFQDYQGDIDLIGQRKPQNYWRAVVYDLSPIELFVCRPAPEGKQQYANNWSYYDELQSWTWDVTPGQDMTVHVYTSGDSVTLRLNGSEVATKAVAETDRRVATFTVPYHPGEIVATAKRNGRTIGVKTLQTVGSPAGLRLTPDVRKLTTDRDDLAHVLIEVIDRKGRLVPDAVTKVSFKVSGAGQLVGVGNGNPHNLDSFQRPRRWTWHGQALAILRPAKRSGTVRLLAAADGLRSHEVALIVR